LAADPTTGTAPNITPKIVRDSSGGRRTSRSGDAGAAPPDLSGRLARHRADSGTRMRITRPARAGDAATRNVHRQAAWALGNTYAIAPSRPKPTLAAA